MDINLEKEFMQLINELTVNKIYVPTDEHSSGFNEIEIEDMEDGTYSISVENSCCVDSYLTFKEIKEEYPKFTLGKNLAFEGKFETWDRYKRALLGEIEITLIEL